MLKHQNFSSGVELASLDESRNDNVFASMISTCTGEAFKCEYQQGETRFGFQFVLIDTDKQEL